MDNKNGHAFLKTVGEMYPQLAAIIEKSPEIIVPSSRSELIDHAMLCKTECSVIYTLPDGNEVEEATLVRAKNGIAVNYPDPYMRRRDPDCMVIADELPTDKVRYIDRFGSSFDPVREETFAWLAERELLFLPFYAGGKEFGVPCLLVSPLNAAFFAAALADLQGFVPVSEIPPDFQPRGILYLAPPFRHTHFDGKQVVVHNRISGLHEIFSYNLYPGPSAKKGAFGILLTAGEREGWLTLHGSTVRVITPYDNIMTILHEGASGGGKSEMIEQMHQDINGRVLVGRSIVTGEEIFLHLSDHCTLQPVTDDMALAPPSAQKDRRHLVVQDAEEGWFLRINHIDSYGTDPFYEKLTIHPPEPLIFLNLQATPNATCLIWEHTMDAPDTPCPNPRVIMPRSFVEDVVNDQVEVDLRSFGIRTPPCTSDKPSYGIIGLFHILPPALAWLWRLVAPRGHANPSITDTGGMTSEGVGSYWPFATGRMVDQANLLLQQMIDTPDTRYKLMPNQYVGAYEVGFMPQWLAREYLSRRGSMRFRDEQLVESRCSLLGFSPLSIKIDGTWLPHYLLQVELQPEVGVEAYDQGAQQLKEFFEQELNKFMQPDLHVTGRLIIECFRDGGTAADYESIFPLRQR